MPVLEKSSCRHQQPTNYVSWKPGLRTQVFKQMAVWPGTMLRSDEIDEFINFVRETLGARIKFVGTVITLPDEGSPGGRHDVMFLVHNSDIEIFAVKRFRAGMRWLEDVLQSEPTIYPRAFLKAYPPLW